MYQKQEQNTELYHITKLIIYYHKVIISYQLLHFSLVKNIFTIPISVTITELRKKYLHYHQYYTIIITMSIKSGNLTEQKQDNTSAPKTPITKQQFDAVCNQIANTTLGIIKICKIIGVSNHSVDEYINIIGADAEQQYARAKDNQLRIIAQEILEIADSPVEPNDSAAVNDKRLRVDTRKWLLSKLKPKTYGDHITVNDESKALPTRLLIELVQPKQQQLTTSTQDITALSKTDDV